MSASHVVLFARSPVRGAVKTRLARSIGDDRALELYRWLGGSIAAALIAQPRDHTLTIAFTPSDAAPAIRAWLPGADAYEPQCDGDLGHRLSTAMRTRFASGAREVIIVGTDCAAVDAVRITQAIACLTRVPCVLGPAFDGGYYLIGATRELPVFSDIPWSTDAVSSRTRERLRTHDIRWEELATERDVDTADDLVTLRDHPEAPDWVRSRT